MIRAIAAVMAAGGIGCMAAGFKPPKKEATDGAEFMREYRDMTRDMEPDKKRQNIICKNPAYAAAWR